MPSLPAPAAVLIPPPVLPAALLLVLPFTGRFTRRSAACVPLKVMVLSSCRSGWGSRSVTDWRDTTGPGLCMLRSLHIQSNRQELGQYTIPVAMLLHWHASTTIYVCCRSGAGIVCVSISTYRVGSETVRVSQQSNICWSNICWSSDLSKTQ
jgi:hypothetical protein